MANMWGMKGKGGKGVFGVQQPMFQKKEPQAGDSNFKTTICKFFLSGQCTKGDGCTFSHGEEEGAQMPPEQNETMCKFYPEGRCTKGASCPFKHEGAEGGKKGCKGGGFEKGGWGGGGMATSPWGAGGMAAWGGKGGKGCGAISPWSMGGGGKGGNSGAPPCSFYAKGTCAKGASCSFSHDGKGGCAKGGFGKGGKSDHPNAGKGHLLPRTRISEAPFSGTVSEWKGKFGWIQCAEPIEHPKAAKNRGMLFCGSDDHTGGPGGLPAGSTVEFHIYEDSSGLGAEEVTAF